MHCASKQFLLCVSCGFVFSLSFGSKNFHVNTIMMNTIQTNVVLSVVLSSGSNVFNDK